MDAAPWRVDEAAPLPERLSISGELRSRFEYLGEQYRSGRTGSDQILVTRTLLHGRWRASQRLVLGLEFLDARAGLDDEQTPLGTGIVNTSEILQAYAELELPAIGGGAPTLRAGRMTIDVGSRRLVARNRFRNTLNAFSGVDLRWQTESSELRAFYTLPVQRRPSALAQLRDNDARADRENLDAIFWGAFGGRTFRNGQRVELFLFGLHERDASDRPTRNRHLYTPGFRWLREPAPSRIDFQLESVFQAGHSRLSAGSDRELDHLAHFHHVEVGYSFECPGRPRVVLQYDYASGDHSPSDGQNERFDTLFGARRFDFGPTSSYGPFARANLSSPGLRVQLRPHRRISGFASYRGYWLASKRDVWGPAGLQDAGADSGRFIGSQLELRTRLDLWPGNLRLELGAARLFHGRFRDEAPGSNRQGDSSFGYVQLQLRF